METDDMNMTNKAFASALLLSAGFAAMGNAEARTSYRTTVSATQACMATTPLNLGGLRFRPLGIFNASANPIYISCSLPIEAGADLKTESDPSRLGMSIYFNVKSSSASATSVDCTFANG